jgi:hypothetical protein
MPSLFVIEHALSDLCDTRQELIEQCAFTDADIQKKDEELRAVDAAIVETITAECRKVDNISRFLLELRARGKAINDEIERLEGMRDGLANTETRIKEMVLQIMRDTDTKKLTGKIGTLRRQNNGGVQAVEVVQLNLVPDHFHRTTIVMPLELWAEVVKQLKQDTKDRLVCESRSNPEPDLTAIRKELEKRVPCPKCKGEGRVSLEEWKAAAQKMVEVVVKCESCGGEGTVPNGVPGCWLADRGEHLRVS